MKCILISAWFAVAVVGLPLPLDSSLLQEHVVVSSRDTKSTAVPTVNTVPADPKTYTAFINTAIQNHWSESVTLPRPNTSNVFAENSLQIDCPHRAADTKNWESADTWPNKIVPSADGQNITIPINTTVLISATSLDPFHVYGTITIPSGSGIVFNDESITLNTRGILIDGGSLKAGSETCRLRSYLTIILHGVKPAPLTAVPPPIVKGIAAVNGGTLDIHGQVYAPAWTRLSVTARKGDTQILVQDLVNWEVGQSILVTTTATKDSRDFNQNDVSVIKNITVAAGIGSAVTVIGLEKPLLYNHYGGSEYQAEVGLLSRRILIKGDDTYSNLTDTAAVCVGDTMSAVSTNPCGAPKGYGGHIQIIGSAIGRVRGVELFQMGQTNVMGRYPYHIHMAKDNGRNSYLDSSSIHQSFFRCMSIHGSSNVTISNNVAFDITGNCFYIEDGVEEDNLFQFNLAAHIHFLGSPTNPKTFYTQGLDLVWEDPVNLIVPTDVTAAPFYITNPYNSFIGNAASGGWAGYSFPSMPAATGLSANTPGISPSSRPLKVFEGNSAHSTGFWWANGAGVYVGGLFKTEANGSLSYNPGRVVSALARTCKVPLTASGSCSSPAWMRFNNTKVFLANRGIMHWGVRVEIFRYEGHDCGISANVFGQVWIDQMLAICRTNNTFMPYLSGCPSAGTSNSWKCAGRDSSYWNSMLGFSWYDTGQNHIISNATFRTCTNAWAPALQRKSMAVWQFLTHSDQYIPNVMQATRNITYQNCNASQLWIFNNYQRTTVSGRLQSWLDFDGTASLSAGRTMIGSSWANEWWNPYGTPKCRLAPANMSMWLCTDDKISEASIYLTADPTQTGLIGTTQCSNGDLSISCPIIGYAAHTGSKNITNGLPLTINTQITGPLLQPNGTEWFVRYNAGSPMNLTISRMQFPSEKNSLVLVLPYPPGTSFNVTANAATWCYPSKKTISGIALNAGAWSANLVIQARGCNSTDGVYCTLNTPSNLSPPVASASLTQKALSKPCPP
ncbi:G8 domain-containing protein [Obelidium mucronatum]|nr:G8 domain-containing protein [Obelidium mucronatum]